MILIAIGITFIAVGIARVLVERKGQPAKMSAYWLAEILPDHETEQAKRC